MELIISSVILYLIFIFKIFLVWIAPGWRVSIPRIILLHTWHILLQVTNRNSSLSRPRINLSFHLTHIWHRPRQFNSFYLNFVIQNIYFILQFPETLQLTLISLFNASFEIFYFNSVVFTPFFVVKKIIFEIIKVLDGVLNAWFDIR